MMVSVGWNLFGARPLFRAPGSPQLGRLVVLGVLLGATLLPAQELVRTAESRLPIQSFKNPEATFHVGPLEEILTGSADVEYTDNINLTDTNKISDLSFHQNVGLNTTWTISHLNQLQFDFGGQLVENFYGNGRTQVTFAISPDSMIQFQFTVSNFRFRLYDNFSYVQNPTTDPTATNTANLNSLTNTLGAAIDADVGLAILSLSVDDTYNNQSGSTAAGTNNAATTGTRNSLRASPSITFNWSPDIQYGLGASATRSTGEHSANVNSLTIGPFINGKLSPAFEFDFSAGAHLVDTKPSIPLDYYYSANVRYQIDRNWQLVLSASHDFIFTTGTGITEEDSFRFGSQLNIARFVTLTGNAFVNFGDTKTTTAAAIASGAIQGNSTQFGADLSVTWKLRNHWSSVLRYQFTRLEADLAVNTYLQNLISFSIGYRF
jgi:hypothetical protein